MTWIDALGWLCAVVGSVMSIPQVVRLLRFRTSAGLSTLMWQLNTASMATWIVHGLRVGAPNITVSNVLSTTLNLLVLRMIQTDRRLPARTLWLPVLALVAVLVVVEVLSPAELFGTLVVLPFAVGQLSQLRDLVRDPDLSGLSPSYLALNLVLQLMWLVWGLAAPDRAIAICAGVLGVLTFVNLAYYGLRRSGLVREPA